MFVHTAAPAAAPIFFDCGMIDDRVASRGSGLQHAFAAHGVRMAFCRGEEIYGEGERADHVYKVVSGAVRIYRILSDGRRQISDFHLAGDVFGLEGGADHRMSAEAIGPAVLLAVRRRVLADLASDDHEVAGQIWGLTVLSLQRTQDHMLLLGRQSACERVCAFLLDLAQRSGQVRSLALPMSRQDMADYLGLTIETVSRTLTQLQGLGWIALPSIRQVDLSDRAAISRLCC